MTEEMYNLTTDFYKLCYFSTQSTQYTKKMMPKGIVVSTKIVTGTVFNIDNKKHLLNSKSTY